MKKTMKTAAALAVLATPALAAGNMENPLYAPKVGEIYSKTSVGLMYKKADGTIAMQMKGRSGAEEFPIWRMYEDIGYGITDRLAIRGQFGYTQDDDIGRKGLHHGRLGLDFRVLDGQSTDGIIWNLYSDAHLGGVSKMTGSYGPTGFQYDNYTNGRWGFTFGTMLGKTWGKFTAAAWGEILHTFGNDNNEIDVTPMKGYAEAGLVDAGVPGGSATISACLANPSINPACGTILGYLNGSEEMQEAYAMTQVSDKLSVNLKSTTEFNLGLKTLYEINSTWSVGGSFTFKRHENNGIESVSTKQNSAAATAVAEGLAKSMADMHDSFNEYIFGLSVANQLTETTQVALYADYTHDYADYMSQNGSDFKVEAGVRLNAQF